MTETAFVPYRTQALMTIHPINTALIPYGHRREIRELELRLGELWKEYGKALIARSNRLARKTFVLVSLPVSCLAAALFLCHVCGILWALGLAACGLVPVVHVAQFAMIRPISAGGITVESRRRTDQLEGRISELKSLDRLTDARGRSERLSAEAMAFNADLAAFRPASCSPGDLQLVEARRSDLVNRIRDLRLETTAA